MPTYLQPAILSRAEALGLKARLIVEGLRVGEHKSPFRGFSVEFVQHREYVPGDDIRHIDWKSYGRSERYTIKQYEQETNLIGHVLLDASGSMLYGSGEANKLEYAKLLAASLAYLIVRQGDSISLRIFDEQSREYLPPSSQMGQLHKVVHLLEKTEPAHTTQLGQQLRSAAEQLRRRGLVFLLSDCLVELEELLEGLRQLRFQGHEVAVFHILHRDEIDFPLDGNLRFDGLEIPEQLKTRPHRIRPAYQRIVQDYLAQVQQGCRGYGCDYVQLDTTRPLAIALAEYLVQRLRLTGR